MPGLKLSDTIMLILIVLAFALVYRGGKKLIFQQKGKGLLALGLLAALGAFYFGSYDQLPENMKARFSDAGGGIRQWTEQMVSSVLPDGGSDAGGLFSRLPDSAEEGGIMENIRDGFQNMDAVKTFFGGISEETEAALHEAGMD